MINNCYLIFSISATKVLKNLQFCKKKCNFADIFRIMAKILVIDDERAIRNTLKDILEFEGHTVESAEDGAKGLERAKNTRYDLIYTDIKMPCMDGMEVLTALKTRTENEQDGYDSADCPVVMISGHGNIETAVAALKKGAFDFIEKPIDLNRLLVTTKNALDHSALKEEIGNNRQEIGRLRKKIAQQSQMVGESTAIARIRDVINKVAPTDARVLITGDNGTGKEIVARLLHEQSKRADKPLVEVNCAAIPGELIESELFGHMKGSFTGAVKDRAGKFEQADGGTLFLDEIGDMSLAAQTKVLRALQENEITRVGSDKTVKVNVRVLAATNKNLVAEIQKGTFREDLYHRLNVIPIHVPSLDERKEDIPLLVSFFAKQIIEEQGGRQKSFMPDAIAALQQRSWPGNIRELRNVVERLLILAGPEITTADIDLYA